MFLVLNIGSRGQVTQTFFALILWATLTIPVTIILSDLLVNFLTPSYNNLQFGSLAILLWRLIIAVFWNLLGLAIIFRGLQGQQSQGA